MKPDLQNKWMEAELGTFEDGARPQPAASPARAALGTSWDYLYAGVRIALALYFALHGAQKLYGLFGGGLQEHNPMVVIGGMVEFAGGICIALGTATRLVSLLLFSETAWIYYKLCLGAPPWPIPKGGELPAFFCLFFLFLATFGPGNISFDAQRSRKR